MASLRASLKKEADVIVIGGGVVGALVLRALSKYRLRVLLLEKGNDFASGVTRANSAVIHAGFDPKPGTKKAKLNVLGNAMFPSLCAQLNVPYIPLASLVTAYAEQEEETLALLLAQGKEYGVPGLSILSRKEILEKEPNMARTAVAALYAPSSAIVSPWEVAIGAVENACQNGAEALRGRTVTAITRENDRFIVTVQTTEGQEVYACRCLVSAAGVVADDICRMLTESDYKITGRRGHYFVLDKQAAGLINHILFPCPSAKGKGVLILPEYHGRIMIGPDSESIDDKTDTATVEEGLARVKEAAASYLSVPIPWRYLIRTFSGVRPTPSTGYFIIRKHPSVPGFVEAAGIESPGLASAPAIAQEVERLVLDVLGGAAQKDFDPVRQKYTAKPEKKDNTLVCRCSQVTRGQIRDAIAGPCGARTVKGVKLRTGTTAGACQGGFCLPDIVSVLSEELHIPKEQVLYDGPGSNLLTGPTRRGEH
jgi:glycerol-3-phosphate dehydrogenase